jgi:hypothetical protein
MNQEAFFEILRTNTMDLPIYGQSGRKLSDKRDRTDTQVPLVYSPDNINELLSSLWVHDSSIRFVSDKDGYLLFGQTGPLIGSTPGHDEMSSRLCRAAGTLTLDSTHQVILGVSYQSGFFKPELKSLIWILRYLCSTDSVFKLADDLHIAYLLENESQDPWETKSSWSTFSVNVEELRGVISGLNPMVIAFAEGFDKPFVSYEDEAPIVFECNGMTASSSFENVQHALNNNEPIEEEGQRKRQRKNQEPPRLDTTRDIGFFGGDKSEQDTNKKAAAGYNF